MHVFAHWPRNGSSCLPFSSSGPIFPSSCGINQVAAILRAHYVENEVVELLIGHWQEVHRAVVPLELKLLHLCGPGDGPGVKHLEFG